MIDVVFSAQLALAAIAAGAIYALVATGLNLVYGTLRLLNIAHGDFVMIGAYLAFWVFTLFDFGPALSLPLSVITGILLGLATYKGLVSVLMQGRAHEERLESNSLLAFFGISIVLQNGAALLFTNNIRAYRYFDQVITLGPMSMTGNRLLTLVISTFLALATAGYLRFTLFGLATRAVIQNRDASSIVVIYLPRIYLVSLCFGFSLACASGVLVSMMEPISPIMGFGYSISAFVVIMLGGLGNLFGGITAAFVLGVIETYGLAFVGSNYRSLLVYGIFILVMILRPEGLFGKSQATR
jgi:branched-chain amino acid transport system permease protein